MLPPERVSHGLNGRLGLFLSGEEGNDTRSLNCYVVVGISLGRSPFVLVQLLPKHADQTQHAPIAGHDDTVVLKAGIETKSQILEGCHPSILRDARTINLYPRAVGSVGTTITTNVGAGIGIGRSSSSSQGSKSSSRGNEAPSLRQYAIPNDQLPQRFRNARPHHVRQATETPSILGIAEQSPQILLGRLLQRQIGLIVNNHAQILGYNIPIPNELAQILGGGNGNVGLELQSKSGLFVIEDATDLNPLGSLVFEHVGQTGQFRLSLFGAATDAFVKQQGRLHAKLSSRDNNQSQGRSDVRTALPQCRHGGTRRDDVTVPTPHLLPSLSSNGWAGLNRHAGQ
mmetsp:Transcript_8677/g.19625  ORF Transcript_8677/g.19625 Transcript_8677/m.19625 type:complete len:342 (-) Transcript_8677:1065-2090(-)